MIDNGNSRTKFDTNLNLSYGIKCRFLVLIWPLYHISFGHFLVKVTALNVILAEYLGVETKLVEQTWIGGVTLVEFENLKKEVQELKELVNTLSKLSSSTPEKKQKKSSENIELESDRLSDNLERIELNTTELAKRFNVSRGAINQYKKKFRDNKITKEEYIEWTKSKDLEGKGWFFDENTNYSISLN